MSLTSEQWVELLMLWEDHGEGDLLDFIHGINRVRRRHGWSTAKMMTILRNMPTQEMSDVQLERGNDSTAG
jgi:hypothetical protein